jgi:endonuclease YncB( thermonuclease family)
MDLLLALVILGLIAVIAARLDKVEVLRSSGSAKVNDGDTITIKGERIRLRGIDAPELGQTCSLAGADYHCGQEAREALRRLIGGRSVECEGWERDKYGRLLASCRAGAVELNKALVEQGWALAFGDFQAEELAARRAARGLWAGDFDRPRQWRDAHGGTTEANHNARAGGPSWLWRLVGWERSYATDEAL